MPVCGLEAVVSLHLVLRIVDYNSPVNCSYLCLATEAEVCEQLPETRERTIHLAADTIRSDSMQKNIGRYDTDTIRLLNCLLC